MIKLILAVALYASAVSPEDRAKHKQWMDDAQDLKEEIREALDARAVEKAAPQAEKLVLICRQELDYWNKAREPQAIELAERTLAAARQMQRAAKVADLSGARQAFDRVEANCKACHDLRFEARP